MDWIESTYSEQTAMRLARSGAQIRILCADDACETCQALSKRTYAPAEVPRLPIRGCTRETCRCQFIAVDPESGLTVQELIQHSIQALRQQNRERANQLLRRVVRLDEMNEQGWLWLSSVVEDREKITCLEKVLAINPRNERARVGLDHLRERMPPAEPETPAAVEPEAKAAGPTPQIEKTQPAVEPAAAAPPAQVIQARQERQVIIAQWQEFMTIAVETDPQMVMMQGGAFLKQLARLNDQAADGLVGAQRLEELEQQWQESERIGEPLATLLHGTDHQDQAGWEPMLASLRELAQKVLEHRKSLREQIAAEGGTEP